MYWQHVPLPYRGLLLRVGSNIQLLGSGTKVGLQRISLGLRSTKRKGALNSAPCEATPLRRENVNTAHRWRQQPRNHRLDNHLQLGGPLLGSGTGCEAGLQGLLHRRHAHCEPHLR